MKKILIVLSVILSILVFDVSAKTENSFLVTSVVEGETVTFYIKYENFADMYGGSFNFVYDKAKLSFVEYEKSSEFTKTTHFINENYSDNKIRVNWVTTTAMPQSAGLLKFKFLMLNTDFENSDISLENLKIADFGGDKTEVGYEFENDLIDLPEVNSILNPTGTTLRPSSGISSESELQSDTSGNVGELLFADVDISDWYYENVKYAIENSLMNGVSETEFAPQSPVTRSMLVTVLYRFEGEPSVIKSIPFIDVDMKSYYANAVIWAEKNNIVNGISETDFAPDLNITREQIAALFFRYAQYKGYDVSASASTDILFYDDAQSVSEYAFEAMQYAVGCGLIKGKTLFSLNPKDNAVRAEIAAVMQRFIETNK